MREWFESGDELLVVAFVIYPSRKVVVIGGRVVLSGWGDTTPTRMLLYCLCIVSVWLCC